MTAAFPELIISKPVNSSNQRQSVLEKYYVTSSHQRRRSSAAVTASCGFGRFRPLWLQDYATQESFTIIFILLGIVHGMCWSYYTATISTLEKRFKINSQTIGFILTGCEYSQILFAFLVSFYGSRLHRTRWIALGCTISAIACYLIASAHLIFGSGQDALHLTREYSEGDNLMNATIPPPVTKREFPFKTKITLCKPMAKDGPIGFEELDHMAEAYSSKMALYLLFTALFIHGIGGILVYTLAGPFLDDHTKRKTMPMVLGFTSSLKLVGPTFGFLLASRTLRIYVNPSLTPLVGPDDPRWIGAWWLGWIVVASSLLCFGFLIALFPQQLKKKGEMDFPRKDHNLLEKTNEPAASISDLPRALKHLLTNKVNMANNFSHVFFHFAGTGYWAYFPKYMETIFMQNASTASIVSAVIGIFSQASGLLLSGYLISKFQFSARQLAAWNTITGTLHMIIMISFIFLGCNPGRFQYGDQNPDGTYNLRSACNQECNCKVSSILPVCHEAEQTAYYSPCHAGCESYDEATGQIKDCRCLPNPSDSVRLGTCPTGSDCYHAFVIFLVVNSIIKFIDSTGRIGNHLISYRCVKLEERSISIGLHITLLSAFSYLPAPIIFGKIIDSVCLVWGGGDSGGKEGNCMLYNSEQLRYVFNLVAASLVFMGVILDCVVWYFVKELDLYKEPGSGDNNNESEKDGPERQNLLPKDD